MLFLACNSFFCCSKIESRTSIRAFFFNPIATVFFCFHRRNCYEVSGASLSKGSLTSFSFFWTRESKRKKKKTLMNPWFYTRPCWVVFECVFLSQSWSSWFSFALHTALRTVAVSGCGGLPSWWHDQSSVVGLWSALTQCSATLLSQVLPASRYFLATECLWFSKEISCGIIQVVWCDIAVLEMDSSTY